MQNLVEIDESQTHTHTDVGCSALSFSTAAGDLSMWGGHGETLDSEATARCNTTQESKQKQSTVMGYGQDILSGQQLLSQLRGDSDFFPHLDNIMTTAPFAYNMSVPELNLAVIKQTSKKQKLYEVIYGYEMPPILRRLTASLFHWNFCLRLNHTSTCGYFC